MATYNYSNQDTKGLKESFDNMTPISMMAYSSLPVFSIESTDQFSEIFASTENISGTRATAEHETPDVNSLEDGYKVTLTNVRYTNAIEVTSTDKEKFRDGSVKVDTYLMRQSSALLRDIQNFFVQQMHDLYNNGFVTTYDAAPDTAALFGSHSWNTAGSTAWDNSATAALTSSSVDTAAAFGGAFKDGSGKPMPQSYDTIFVKLGGSASREAKKLFAENISPTAVNDVNIYQGEYRIVESPYITSSTAWFMMDTKQYPSAVYAGISKYPTMAAPLEQNNMADRFNVEGFWKKGINNLPFNLYGSTGAA